MKTCYRFLLIIALLSATVCAQVSIGSFGTAYTQNFNSLASSGTPSWINNSTISGWYSNRTTYLIGPIDDPGPTAGLYSFGSGTASERALGAIPNSTTSTIYYGVRMQNNTGAEIRSFTISYTGEQWRSRNSGGTQVVTFGYRVAASFADISSGTYTGVSALNFTSPITSGNNNILDGNSSANQQSFSNVVVNVVVPNGQEIMFRWADISSGSNTNNEHGLGIDNVSISAWPEDNGLPVELSSFSALPGDGQVTLQWVTESEVNNVQFDILRALQNNGEYVMIGSREGQYNTNQRTEYSFTDNAVANGTTYWYKLVDVDLNGLRTEHGPVFATPGLAGNVTPDQFKLYQNYPNPFNPSTTLQVYAPANPGGQSPVKVEIYNVVGEKIRTIFEGNLAPGVHALIWNGESDRGSAVPGGIYFAVLRAGAYRESAKLVLLK